MPTNEKDEDSIHLRAVRFGVKHPNGFAYGDIEKHYSKRKEEWDVVKVFLLHARRNVDANANLNTPFTVLKVTGAGDNEAMFTLSYDAYFNYLGYVELTEARRSAKTAFKTAVIAIGISIAAMIMTSYYAQKQIDTPVILDQQQYQSLLETVKTPKL